MRPVIDLPLLVSPGIIMELDKVLETPFFFFLCMIDRFELLVTLLLSSALESFLYTRAGPFGDDFLDMTIDPSSLTALSSSRGVSI